VLPSGLWPKISAYTTQPARYVPWGVGWPSGWVSTMPGCDSSEDANAIPAGTTAAFTAVPAARTAPLIDFVEMRGSSGRAHVISSSGIAPTARTSATSFRTADVYRLDAITGYWLCSWITTKVQLPCRTLPMVSALARWSCRVKPPGAASSTVVRGARPRTTWSMPRLKAVKLFPMNSTRVSGRSLLPVVLAKVQPLVSRVATMARHSIRHHLETRMAAP